MFYRHIACAASFALFAVASPACAGALHASMKAGGTGALRVDVGTFGTSGSSLVPAGYCPANDADIRRQNTAIQFSPAFSAPPAIAIGLNEVDAGDGRNIRVNAYAINVTKDGATLVVETWCDTDLYSASGSIVAVGPR